MAKGLYTAAIMVLFERAPGLDEVERALGRWTAAKRLPQGKEPEAWIFGGPTLVYPLAPEGPGRLVVDVVDRPWPDGMGDPKRDPMVFGGWSLGQFGPLTFPGDLDRAAEHTWSCPEAKELPARHQAFVRVRVTHVAGEHDPVIPAGYDPVAELRRTSEVALALVGLPGALAYFNPAGEVLLTPQALRERDAHDREHDLLPVDTWTNIRMLRLDAEWMVMDTVGLGQLDRCDVECCFSDARQDPDEVERFLRNVSLYLVQRGEVIKTGETVDGPGTVRWRALVLDEGITVPPRRVLRLFPEDGSQPPDALLATSEEEARPAKRAKKAPPSRSARAKAPAKEAKATLSARKATVKAPAKKKAPARKAKAKAPARKAKPKAPARKAKAPARKKAQAPARKKAKKKAR